MNVFSTLQKIGRAFVLPIAILPVAGIFLGVGAAFTNDTMINAYNLQYLFGQDTLLRNILSIMRDAGEVVFANLSILFAIGVAVGMSNEEQGVAALAAAIGFFIMHKTIGSILDIQGFTAATTTVEYFMSQGLDQGAAVGGSQGYTKELGIFSLQMGVFGGIITGLVTSYLHNRFCRIELPMALSFFGGTRFVPIVTAFTMLFVGAACTVFWPPVQAGITLFSVAIDGLGNFGVFLFGFISRLLFVIGLHPVLYMPLWWTSLGGTLEVDGQLISGGQRIFFAQLASENVEHFSTLGTRFLTGGFPVMMFGHPGAAYAMYQAARPEKRKVVAGVLFSAAFTSFLTGITEPIEFLWLFTAPGLFIIHSALEGLAYMLCYMLNITVGITFSRGIIDFILFGVLQGNAKTNYLLLIPMGIAYMFIYYFMFKFAIQKFNLKTPGRGDEDDIEILDLDTLANSILDALGGVSNVSDFDSCATRLRITVIDPSKVGEESVWKKLGANGLIKSGTGVQAIYGPKANLIKTRMQKLMKK